MNTLFTAAHARTQTFIEITRHILDLHQAIDCGPSNFLGLQGNQDSGAWRDTFVSDLIRDNLKYRLNALAKLRLDAKFVRVSDLASIMEEDLIDIAHMSANLESQANEISMVFESASMSVSMRQRARWTDELGDLRSLLSKLRRDEAVLQDHFQRVNTFLQSLSLPEKEFENLIQPLEGSPVANGHETIDFAVHQLDALRANCSLVPSAVQEASERWFKIGTEEHAQQSLMREMLHLQDRCSHYALMQDQLVDSLLSFRMVTITSPKTLLTDNGDVVAVEELLSTLDLFKKLERQTIDLHSAQLEWHLKLESILNRLRTTTDICADLGLLSFPGLRLFVS